MDPQKLEDLSGSQDLPPDRPLGRGLEQISHLFLTQRTARDSAPSSAPARPQAGRMMLLQPNRSVTKDRLVAVLRESQDALEEGLHVVDAFVSCHPHSDIDLLATNRANQLTVIDLETGVDDALVLRGLAHCDWLYHNLPGIRRMYPGEALDMISPPRLFLIAPQFSGLVLSAARRLTALQIHWIRYHAFDTGSDTGVFFEKLISE